MRSRDHDAGDGALEPDGVTHLRRGTYVVEDEDLDAVGRHHFRRDAGELLAAQAAVIRDADLQVSPAAMAQDIVRQALRSYAHRVFVHPVGADAHQSAQAAGAELQVLVERVFQTRGVLVAECDDLGLGRRVEIPGEPLLYIVPIVCHMLE